jgi:hypothetical protein
MTKARKGATPAANRIDEPVVFSGDPRKLVTCYNPSCADYRRDRAFGEACACKKKSVREPMLSITPEF